MGFEEEREKRKISDNELEKESSGGGGGNGINENERKYILKKVYQGYQIKNKVLGQQKDGISFLWSAVTDPGHARNE